VYTAMYTAVRYITTILFAKGTIYAETYIYAKRYKSITFNM